jgi:hypothetical protein
VRGALLLSAFLTSCQSTLNEPPVCLAHFSTLALLWAVKLEPSLAQRYDYGQVRILYFELCAKQRLLAPPPLACLALTTLHCRKGVYMARSWSILNTIAQSTFYQIAQQHRLPAGFVTIPVSRSSLVIAQPSMRVAQAKALQMHVK